MNKILFLIIGIGLLFSAEINGQDTHLSQFYHSPLSLNPAMTGLMNYDVRVTANYRNQWATVTTPFQTMEASVDASILGGVTEDDFFGVGLLLNNDKAGDSQLRTTRVHLSTAYSKSLSGDANHYISLGGQAGLAYRSLNVSELTFDSQFDGDILNTNIGSGEQLDRQQFYYWDFSAGVAWFYAPTEESSIYAGAALSHINEPNQSFFQGVTENLYRKLTVHLGGEVALNESFSLLPRGELLLQGPHTEVNVGGLVKFNLTPGFEQSEGAMALYLGTTHRFKDAQIVVVRYDYGPIGIGFSYDFNISSLGKASKYQGGPEVAIIYRTNLFQEDERSKRGAVRCPSAY